MEIRNYLIYFIFLFCLNTYALDPSTEEKNLAEKRDIKAAGILKKIEADVRKRCPSKKIGRKVISLCHGEERWDKKLDSLHTELFLNSDYFQYNNLELSCQPDSNLRKLLNDPSNKSIPNNGFGIFLLKNNSSNSFNSPLETWQIDYNSKNSKNQKNDLFLVLLDRNKKRNNKICDLRKNDIPQVHQFHDPNCDVEIMSEGILTKFISLSDEDINQIFQELNNIHELNGGCINSLMDLFLLKDTNCIASRVDFPKK